MVEYIASICGYILSAIAIIVSIALKIKGSKTNAELQTEKANTTVFDKVSEVVAEAEKIFKAGNGYAKLSYALNKLQMIAIQVGAKVSADDLKAKIEAVLTTPQKKVDTITPTSEII